MSTDRRDRRQRTRLVVLGIVQIVWGVLLLFLATGVALFWFSLALAVLALFLLQRALYTRATRPVPGDGTTVDDAPIRQPVATRLAIRWGTVGLTLTGVLLVATGTALVFDGLGQ